jgi:CheY-like chemotaxis protein/HPt (histidine-containing phosphotransfer) domain-containing protein
MTSEEFSHLQELLEVLEGGVLALDRPGFGDPVTAVHKLFQSAHNLKSGLAMAGLPRAAHYIHGLEDGLDSIRRGKAQWSGTWVDRVLDAVDLLRTCLDDNGDDSLEGVEVEKVVEKEGQARSWGMKLTDAEKARCDAAAGRGEGLYRIEKFFGPGLAREDFEGHMILDDIRASGSLITRSPDFDTYAKSEGEIVVRFMFSSPQTAAELEQLFFDPLITVKAPGPERRRESERDVIRFLLVDDDEIQSQVLGKILATYGETVLKVDGKAGVVEFIDALRVGKGYQVVVLDIEMPRLDGIGALREIRAHEAGQGIHGLDCCTIFMNSTSSDLPKVKQAFRDQADGYFIKPFSHQEIQKKVEALLPALQNRTKG